MMGGWLNSLKDKAKELGEVYKRDLGEFASQVKHDAAAVIESEFGDDTAPPKPKPKPVTPAKRAEAKAVNKAVSRVAAKKQQPGVSPKLAALREASVTYTHDPPDKAAYEAFAEKFDAKERTSEITEMLRSNPAMEELHRKLCPEQVTYKAFWSRYFFREQALLAEERKTQLLLSASENLFEEDDLAWDDEVETPPPKEEPTAAAAQRGAANTPASKEPPDEASVGNASPLASGSTVGLATGVGVVSAAPEGGDSAVPLASPSIALRPTEVQSFTRAVADSCAGPAADEVLTGSREGGGGSGTAEIGRDSKPGGQATEDGEGDKVEVPAVTVAAVAAVTSLAASGLAGSVSSAGLVGMSETSSSPCVVSAAVSADPSLDNASSQGSSNSRKDASSGAAKGEDAAGGGTEEGSAGVAQEAAKPKQDDDWDDWE